MSFNTILMLLIDGVILSFGLYYYWKAKDFSEEIQYFKERIKEIKTDRILGDRNIIYESGGDIKRYEKEIKELKQQIDEYEAAFKRKDEIIDTLTADIQSRDAEIERLTQELKQRDEAVEEKPRKNKKKSK